jgi:hypothetical protein
MSDVNPIEMTYDRLVEVCRELRTAFERDEARFMIALVDIENEHMPLLKDNGCKHFGQFLKSYHLCDYARYGKFRGGLVVVGRERALFIGAPAVCRAGTATSPETAEGFTQAAIAWRTSKGVGPSDETALRLLRQVDPIFITPKVVKNENRMELLEAEIHILKANLRSAEALVKKQRELIRQQEATISRLRKKCGEGPEESVSP